MTRPMPPARITSPISTGGTYDRPAFIHVRIAGSTDRYSTRTRNSPSAGLPAGSSMTSQSEGLGRPIGRAARRHSGVDKCHDSHLPISADRGCRRARRVARPPGSSAVEGTTATQSAPASR